MWAKQNVRIKPFQYHDLADFDNGYNGYHIRYVDLLQVRFPEGFRVVTNFEFFAVPIKLYSCF